MNRGISLIMNPTTLPQNMYDVAFSEIGALNDIIPATLEESIFKTSRLALANTVNKADI